MILSFALLAAVKLSGQSIDDLKLSEKEIPADYSLVNENKCLTMQACMFYENTETFEKIVGVLKEKRIQNFDNEKDKGSIMYFEFENDFEGEAFLKGFIWGATSPSKEHPEGIYVKGKIVIIWNFNKNSKIAAISKNKIKKMLK